MKLLLSLVVLLSASASPAAALKIDCVFADPAIKDHVLVELATADRGTFYYQSETDDTASGTPTDKLELKRVASDRNDIAKWRVNREEVGLYFLMPSTLVSKPADGFKADLLTQIPELNLSHTQEMECSSRF